MSASLLLAAMIVALSACGNSATPTPVVGARVLDCQLFRTTVFPILIQDIGGRTCAASGCHAVGSNGGRFSVYPDAQSNPLRMQASYESAMGMADLGAPANSLLLLKPLALAADPTGTGHAGGDIFPSTIDPNYDTIFDWISTQVTGPSSCL